MALIKCPECGKEYSNLADKCPNCACPTKIATKTTTTTKILTEEEICNIIENTLLNKYMKSKEEGFVVLNRKENRF